MAACSSKGRICGSGSGTPSSSYSVPRGKRKKLKKLALLSPDAAAAAVDVGLASWSPTLKAWSTTWALEQLQSLRPTVLVVVGRCGLLSVCLSLLLTQESACRGQLQKCPSVAPGTSASGALQWKLTELKSSSRRSRVSVTNFQTFLPASACCVGGDVVVRPFWNTEGQDILRG